MIASIDPSATGALQVPAVEVLTNPAELSVETTHENNTEQEKSQAQLRTLSSMVQATINTIEKPTKLIFKQKPSFNTSYPEFEDSHLAGVTQTCANLKAGVVENDIVLNAQTFIREMHSVLEAIPTRNDHSLILEKNAIFNTLTVASKTLYTYQREAWERQARINAISSDGQHDGARVVIADHVERYETLKKMNPEMFISLWLGLVSHYLCNLSRARSNFILTTLKTIISMTQARFTSTRVVDGAPDDIRTAAAIFGLKPTLTKYMSCPDCRKLYNAEKTDSKKGHPEFCSHRELSDGAECGTRLWKVEQMQGVSHFVPRLTFMYQNFPNWLARLLSRRGIEKILRSPITCLRNRQIIRDIWDGDIVQMFEDESGRPFFNYKGPELRLLFGFGYDNFNPFHNKAGRKKGSVGALYLICFNLPPELRLLPENILLAGVVPGPKQPSLTQLNHYVEPLVEDLRIFYKSGYYFPSTADTPSGVVARGAAFPGIMDLHAARQIFGMGSYQSKWFCTHCLLSLDDIDNVDPQQWPRWHTSNKHQAIMEAWKDSPTVNNRDKLFKSYNMRWTAFSRLPYFDMEVMCILDPMHAFQNVFRNLIENTWGMNNTRASGDGIFVGSRPDNVRSVTNNEVSGALKAIQTAIQIGDRSALDETPRAPLWFLCELHELRRVGERLQPYRRTIYDFYEQSPTHLVNDIQKFRARPANQGARDPKTIGAMRIRLASVHGETQTETETWLSNQSKADICQICRERGVTFESTETREILAAKLIQNQLVTPLPIRSQDLSTGRPVLGKNEIQALDVDFARMSLPSWVQTGPRAFNANSHGQLSASEWRTSVLIRLVVTLPRLWCDLGPRHSSMLDNFMHLVNAAVIASTRTVKVSQTGESTTTQYQQEYSSYLRGRVQLYPTGKIQPTEHFAYHLGDQMKKFGPLPIASTNALERCNGMLQDIPTNRQWSHLEKTLMNKFCEAGNIKTLMNTDIFDSIDKRQPEIASTLRRVRCLFEQTFMNETSSMFQEVMNYHEGKYFWPKLSDLTETNKLRITDAVMILLIEYLGRKHPSRRFMTEGRDIQSGLISVFLQREGWSLTECQHYGVYFRKAVPRMSPLGKQPSGYTPPHGDSYIWFQTASFPATAGIITDIFAYEYFSVQESVRDFDIYLTVRTFVPLTIEEAIHDPYRKYSISGGKLYHYKLEEKAQIISIHDVVCHLAMTPLKRGEISGINTHCVHVLPLIWHHQFK